MIKPDLNIKQEDEIVSKTPDIEDSNAEETADELSSSLEGKKPRRARIIKWLSIFVILGAIAGGGFLIYQTFFTTTQPSRGNRRSAVNVERATLPITITANGTIQPELLINVSPKSTGRLKSLLVKQGDRVVAGQILAYMDDSNLQGQLTQAQGQLAAAEANLQKVENGNRPQEIGQAKANLRSAQANLRQLELNFSQNQSLFTAGAINARDFETSRSTRDAARAQVVQAQQALSLQETGSRPEDIAQAEAQVITAQGALQSVQVQVEDTVIKAPFSGTVSRKYADPGAFVSPSTSGSSVSSSTTSSILALASNNQVVANVAEVNIAMVKLGQVVTIQADAYPGRTFKGKVSEISPQSTVLQNVTSFEVKVSILSDTKQELRAGMNVNTEFKVGQLNNSIVVPTVAIVRQQNATGVYVKNGNNPPTFTTVVTGVSVDDKTEIKSGLNGDEQVLISFPPGTRPQSNIPGSRGGGIPGLQQPRVR